VDSVHAVADSETAAILRGGAAENLKRVHVLPENEEFSDEDRWRSPRRLAAFIETKTIWHPSAC
jgi:hypothetical protein